MIALRHGVFALLVCLLALPSPADTLQGTLTFQTSTPQSIWGEGASSPHDWSKSMAATWNASTPGYSGYYGAFWTQDTYLFGEIEWGGGIRGASSGTLGIGATFEVMEPGSVSVTYPVTPTIIYPQPNTFAAGETITIETSYELPPAGFELKTVSPQFRAALGATFGLGVDAGARYCIFGCGTATIVPRFDMAPVDFEFLSISNSGVETPFGPLDLTGDPVSILHVPAINTLDTSPDPADEFLSADGTDHFLQIGVDLASLVKKAAEKKTKRTLPGLTWESPESSPAHIKYDLLKLMAVSNLTAKQSFKFDPELKVRVAFGQPLEHWSIDGATESAHEISDSADIRVGATLKVKYPETDRQPTDVGPLFRLDNSFRSSTDVTFAETFDPTLGHALIELPRKQVFPEICTPEVKVAGVVVVPEICTPSWSIGPYKWEKTVWSDSFKVVTQTYSVFSDDWQLGGFKELPLATFALDPENPIVQIAQTTGASRNLGSGRRQVAYAIDVANEGDVDLDLVHLTSNLAQAFGDAWKFQVDTILACGLPVNPDFDGRANLQLFSGDTNTLHNPIDPPQSGTTARVILIISIWPKPDPLPYVSTAEITSVSHFVRTPTDKSGSSSVLLGPGIIETADDLVLFGDRWVKLEAIGDTFGHIGSNDFIEIKNGASGVVAGDLRAGRSMKVQGTIAADYVLSPGRVDVVGRGSLTLTGNVKSPANIALFKRNAPQFKPDAPYSGNVWVTADTPVELEGGYYGDVTVNPGATLTLAPGSYHFLSLVLLDNARVVLAGPSVVTIRGTLSLGAGAQLTATGSSRSSIVQLAGPNEVAIGPGALFRGVLSAPRANVFFLESSELQGSAYGSSITLRPGARASYHVDCDPVVDPDCDGSPNCQ